MIRRLAAHFKDLQMLVGAARGFGDGILQFLRAHVRRAGAGHQDALGREHLNGKLIQSLVGGQRFRQVLLALGECGRIDDDDIETRPLFGEFFEYIEGIAFARGQLDAIAQCVRQASPSS